jgi:hypothetical protein
MKLKSYLIIYLGIIIMITPIVSIYDKYMNTDVSLLPLRMGEVPFYTSKYLYSSHYMKLKSHNNSTAIIFS